MKNRTLTLIMSLIMVMSISVTVFASSTDDTATGTSLNDISEEQKEVEEETSDESKESEKNESEDNSGCDEISNKGIFEQKSDTEEITVNEELAEKESETVTIVTEGNGSVSIENGELIIKPDDGYEAFSITADKDYGKYRSGKEITDRNILIKDFSEGTVLTIVFEKIENTDIQWGIPESGTAVFE